MNWPLSSLAVRIACQLVGWMTTVSGSRKLEPRTPFAALKIASALSSVPLA